MCAASRISTGSTQSLFSICRDAALRRNRQRKDHEIDPGTAGELDQFIDRAELLLAGKDRRSSIIAAIVEYADDAHVAVTLRSQRFDEGGTIRISANDDRPTVEPTGTRPMPHHQEQCSSKADQRQQTERIEAAEPDTRELIPYLGEEGRANGDQK